MDLSKYERQGERAFLRREPREACRYKKPEIVAAWQIGWERQAEICAKAEAAAKVPRWVEYGGRAWANPPEPPTSYSLRGDAPRIVVHQQVYDRGRWFVSCHEWGIESVRLDAAEPEAAKLEAVTKVRLIMSGRLDLLLKVADADGTLIPVGCES